MIRAPGRATSRSDTLLLLVCLLLSASAIALPDRLSQNIAAALRDTILSPLLWIQRQATEGRTSRRRFQAVQAERDSVALASQSMAELIAENTRLRALLELRARTGSTSVPAEVLHQTSPTEGRTLLLGVGARSGIRSGDPVVSPEGLLGVLLSVGERTSVAMTWAHPDFRVSAATEDGSSLGIVAPSLNTDASETFLEFRGVAYRDSVATGTLVMTSGLGGVYPRGVPIGRVAGVRREELGYERIYRLAPMANPGHVAHVLIVRTLAAADSLR
ncbi:MAG TPA: rod shape-determining protein MreC [Gemmatimonadales bacterium]|nr:rod shape-determining protein MreC [Gemmatimonadales bacterium]